MTTEQSKQLQEIYDKMASNKSIILLQNFSFDSQKTSGDGAINIANNLSLEFDVSNYSTMKIKNMRLYNTNNYLIGSNLVIITANDNTALQRLYIERYGSTDTGILNVDFDISNYDTIKITQTARLYAHQKDLFLIGELLVQ